MKSSLPVTVEENLLIREPKVPTDAQAVINDLERFVREEQMFTDDFKKMRRKMFMDSRLPTEPCYITKELYDKSGKLVHVVGKGAEFNGLDENGRPMLLYDKHGGPKNADGSVRRWTIGELMEIRRKEYEENLPSNLPRRPKLSKRKMAKKRKNPPPRKLLDDVDDVIAAEAERLRRINERL